MNAVSPQTIVDWLSPAPSVQIMVEHGQVEKKNDLCVVIEAEQPFSPSVMQGLQAIGFLQESPTKFVRKGGSFTAKEMKAIFSSVRLVKRNYQQTRRFVDTPSSYTRLLSLRDSFMQSTQLTHSPQNSLQNTKKSNRFQVQYRPASRIGEPIANIPSNLARPTQIALEKLEDAYGNIDAFVGGRLNLTDEEMGKILAPEQVDAIGLGLSSADKGGAFILADQTGLGKGRTLAGIAKAMALSNKLVILVTEKENLFTDFWRDVKDIGADGIFGQPFLLNDKSKILDQHMNVVFEALPSQDLAKHIKNGTLPNGSKLVLTTYSQFNREGSLKAEFLKKIAEGAHLILDEAHNAVGDSNTSINIDRAAEVAESLTYSSATYAKKAESLAAYKRLFPPSMRSSDLMSILSSGGQALSEAVAQTLAENGSYIRREHDLSGITINVIEDTLRNERNKELANALSPILQSLGKLARTISSIADERNEPMNGEKPKEFWYAGNFGSRLAAIMRQFMTSLLVDLCVERSVDAISKGLKPVVIIESTMESLMKELSSDRGPDKDGYEGVEDDQAVDDAIMLAESGLVQGKYPDLREALKLFLDRTITLSCKRKGAQEPEKYKVDDPEVVKQVDKIMGLIDQFPDLSMSLIDDVKERIEKKGAELGYNWVCDEISARGMCVKDGKYEILPPRNRLESVANFNNGNTDALVITKAASTGLSLHSSSTFTDQRQRKMIELQIASNVVERLQFHGRVNRRGQMNIPLFDTLSTGLPIQSRSLAMNNKKMEDLSANVTGSSLSSSAMDIPDVLDSIGNAIAKEILEERKNLSDKMFIAMKLPDPAKAESELYHVNKLLQRLCLLPSNEADAVFDELISRYKTQISDMASKGTSPKKAREMDGQWRIVSSEVFEPGDPDDGAVFGRPVMVTTLESSRFLNPMKSKDVIDLIEKNESAVKKQGQIRFPIEKEAIERITPRLLQTALSEKDGISVREALKSNKMNGVKIAEERLMRLHRFIQGTKAGSQIAFERDGDQMQGVIVEVRPPSDIEDAHHAGRWKVRFICPGDEKLTEISAHAAMNGGYKISTYSELPHLFLKKFDSAPRGEVPVIRKVLDGNLVKAVITSRHQGWGSPTSYVDTNGVERKGILIPKSKQNSLDSLPMRTVSCIASSSVLQMNGMLWTDQDHPENGAQIWMEDEAIKFSIPAKKNLSKIFESDGFEKITGFYKTVMDRKIATIPIHKANDLMKLLVDEGHAFHFDGAYREVVGNALVGHDDQGKFAP